MKRCSSCGRVYSDLTASCPICNTPLTSNTSQGAYQNYGAPQGSYSGQQVSQNYQNYASPVSTPQQSVYQQPISQQPVYPQPVSQQSVGQQPAAKPEKGNWLWGLLGLVFPIAGWIAWGCLKKNHPASAKIAGYAGLIGFLLNIVLSFLSVVSM